MSVPKSPHGSRCWALFFLSHGSSQRALSGCCLQSAGHWQAKGVSHPGFCSPGAGNVKTTQILTVSGHTGCRGSETAATASFPAAAAAPGAPRSSPGSPPARPVGPGEQWGHSGDTPPRVSAGPGPHSTLSPARGEGAARPRGVPAAAPRLAPPPWPPSRVGFPGRYLTSALEFDRAEARTTLARGGKRPGGHGAAGCSLTRGEAGVREVERGAGGGAGHPPITPLAGDAPHAGGCGHGAWVAPTRCPPEDAGRGGCSGAPPWPPTRGRERGSERRRERAGAGRRGGGRSPGGRGKGARGPAAAGMLRGGGTGPPAAALTRRAGGAVRGGSPPGRRGRAQRGCCCSGRFGARAGERGGRGREGPQRGAGHGGPGLPARWVPGARLQVGSGSRPGGCGAPPPPRTLRGGRGGWVL